VNAQTLIDTLTRKGLHLALRGDRIGVQPRELLTDEDRRLILDHRDDLIALLAPVDTKALGAGWRGSCHELGALAGWPHLPFADGREVPPGEYSWRKWINRADVPSMELVRTALREYLARLPMPEPDMIPVVPNSPTLPDGSPANVCPDCGGFCGSVAMCTPCASKRAATWREAQR